MKETKSHFSDFLSRTHPNSHKVNVYCCCLVAQTDRVTYVECVTEQHIESTEIVQCSAELY